MAMDEDPCEQCGSQNFYIQDGQTFCSNGHHQHRGAEIGDDEDDYGTQGKRINIKEHKEKQKILKKYKGKKAYRLFLQAYQHILWKQCDALVHEKGYPAVLWDIVRDLWSLRLSTLLQKLEDPLEGDGNDLQGIPSGAESHEESGGENETPAPGLVSTSPSLVDTICLCYMAMLLMRLPTSLSKVFRWISEEDVPYIRAIRHVPADMRDKLPGEYHEALDTSTTLRQETLQTGVLNLCSVYIRTYGMNISPLNTVPVLYEYVKNLSLPLEVYAAAKSLNEILNFDFKYTDTRGTRRTALSYPEAQLMSLVVIATKLLSPFDNGVLPRSSRQSAEETLLSVDWKAWVDTRRRLHEAHQSKRLFESGKEIHVKDTDVFNLSAQQLDQYMDWYQRTWIKSTLADGNVKKELLDMFPLQPVQDKHVDPAKALLEEEVRLEQVRAVQASLKMYETVTSEEVGNLAEPVLRPGMRYQQFRNPQALNISDAAKTFHHEASDLSCLSLDMLLRAVLQTEQKIVVWRREKRRAENSTATMDLEEEEATLFGLEDLIH